MDLSKLDVTVTNGKMFTGEESAKLALMIHRRFANDGSAWRAWSRMLESNCGKAEYIKLAKAGEILEQLNKCSTYSQSTLEINSLLKELDNL